MTRPIICYRKAYIWCITHAQTCDSDTAWPGKSQNIIGKSTRLSGTMYNYISDAENIVNQSFGKADVWYTWISFLWCWWGLLGSQMPTNGSSSKKENSRNTVKPEDGALWGRTTMAGLCFCFLSSVCSGWIHDDWRGFVHKINRRV